MNLRVQLKNLEDCSKSLTQIFQQETFTKRSVTQLKSGLIKPMETASINNEVELRHPNTHKFKEELKS